MSMDSGSSHSPDGSPKPKRLKTMASDVKFSGGNTLLHLLVLDQSSPNHPGSGHYVNAVLLSMSDVPARVVNALNDDGYSALHLAVKKNDLTMVNKLLSRLVNIDIDAICGRDDENTALHLAVESGHASIVRELLDKGASIALPNSDGETAVSVATSLRALDLVKMLVSADKNEHASHTTPLHEAARYGSLEVAQFLIDRGADVDARNELDMTPLHDAARGGNLDVAKLLISKGADLDASDDVGYNALHYAVEEGNLDIVKCLIGKGADLEAVEQDGMTPLHVAVTCHKSECATFLLDHGADLHAADEDGWTPLHIAAYGGHVDLARLLLDRGADVSVKNGNGKTPLDLAREEQNQSCIDVLENV